MTLPLKVKGAIFAVLAALMNSSVGVFSVKLVNQGLSAYAIAFYKCFISLLLLILSLIITKQWYAWLVELKKNAFKLAFCAFFGFFVLYFFETNAYRYAIAPVVVFTLIGSATICTFILNAILEKRLLYRKHLFSLVLALLGLLFFFHLSSFIFHWQTIVVLGSF